MLRDRVGHLLDSGLHHAQAFVNQGRAAGSSIDHPHAQIVGLDFVPPAVKAEQDRFTAAGRDLVAEALAAHRSSELSVVDGPAVAWCPPASSSPFEILVAHRSTRARFDEAPDAEVAVVARASHEALALVDAALGGIDYNLTLHTAPRGAPPGGHWYVRITPRVSVVAGFEHSTGVFVNVVPPEVAAGALREAVGPSAALMRIRVRTTIDVRPGDLWALLEDISGHVEWMRDAESITFRSSRRHGVGTEFECMTRVGPLRTRDVMRVTEWEPGHSMGIEHRGVVTGRGRFTLRARRGGRTLFTWSERLTFPWWMGGPAGALLAGPVLRRIWRGNLRRLEHLAEQGISGR